MNSLSSSRSTSFLRRYRDPLVALLLFVLPLIFYLSNSKSRRDYNGFDRVIVAISAPVQWVVVHGADAVFRWWHHYVGLVRVQARNDALTVENARLRRELDARQEEQLENVRLRLLLGLKERSADIAMILARVVAASPSPLFRSLRVDRGLRDGVQLGAAVVNEDGVVGRVAAVTAGYADVMLVVDANSSLDVLVQRTRAHARIRGAGDDHSLGLEAEYLERTADVEPGDLLVTSGAGEAFPKGLGVGTVTSIKRGAFGLYQHASVVPRVDFSRIEEVMILPLGWAKEADFSEQSSPTAEANGAAGAP